MLGVYDLRSSCKTCSSHIPLTYVYFLSETPYTFKMDDWMYSKFGNSCILLNKVTL